MRTIDFNLIHNPLYGQLVNIRGSLGRESRNRFADGFPFTVSTLLRVADNTYCAIRRLVVEDANFVGPAKVLCRSLLDIVFNVYLLLSDPVEYTLRFWKAGWREKHQYLATNIEELGPDDDWVEEYQHFLETAAKTAGLTNNERGSPSSIDWWPTGPQVLKNKTVCARLHSTVLTFLTKLNKLYYGPLSAVLHVSERGLVLQAFPLLRPLTGVQREIATSEPVHIAQMCMLTLLTEVNAHFEYPHGPKLQEAWTYLTETVEIHKVLYELRCKELLSRV